MLAADDVLEDQSSGGTDRQVRRWLGTAVVIALLVAIAVHVFRARQDLADIERLSIWVLTITCALQFGSQLLLNQSLLLPLQTCVKGLRFWELYLVRTGGFFVGSMVPVAGGLAVRLAYLRGRGLSYMDFTWATLFSNVLALGAAALVAAAGTVALWMIAGQPPTLVLAVSAGVFSISVAAVLAFEFLPRLARHPRLRKWESLSTMTGFHASRRLAAAVFGVSTVRHVLNFTTFGMLYQTLTRVPGDLLTGGLVYALTSPIRMVTITPGNLGVTEWFVALVGKALAFDVTTGLIVAITFRGTGLVAQGLAAVLGSSWLAVRSRR